MKASTITEQQLADQLRTDAGSFERCAPVDLHARTMAAIRADVIAGASSMEDGALRITPTRRWRAGGSLLAAMVAMLVCLAAAMAVQPDRHMHSGSTGPETGANAGDVATAGPDTDQQPAESISRIAAARRAMAERLKEAAATQAGGVIKAEVRAIAHDVSTAVDRLIAKVPLPLRERFSNDRQTSSDA